MSVARVCALLDLKAEDRADGQQNDQEGQREDHKNDDDDDDDDDDPLVRQSVPMALPHAPSSNVSRALQAAEAMALRLAPHNVAMLVVFARTAALRAQILAYDLGAATREAQARAICRRLLATDALSEFERAGKGDALDFVHTRLPEHCAHVFCCTECRRVVNALQDGSGKDLSFNEIGLSASMLRIEGKCGAGHMRCAKRSSAALRTAVGLETEARALAVEALPAGSHGGNGGNNNGGEEEDDDDGGGDDKKDDAVQQQLLPRDLRPATVATSGICSNATTAATAATAATATGAATATTATGAASAAFSAFSASAASEPASDVARLRRDVKNCLEQTPRALACGDAPLVRISVLGRAVRVFGDWVAICAYCGALAKLTPDSRFRADPCCMRCDFAMLRSKAAERALMAQVPRPPPPRCRYCGKQETPGATAFKEVPAPADTGGRNAIVPPPLRKCW